MRPHAQIALMLSCFVAGCPNTDATSPSIAEVVPEGDTASTSFRLKVVGRGFGLKSVQFDLSNREGVASLTELSLVIERSGVMKRIDAVEVESPRVLYGQVVLTEPLPGDVYYDVALFEGATEIARRPEAFYVAAATSTETPDGGTPDIGPLQKDAAPMDGAPGDDAGDDAGEPMDGDAPDAPDDDDAGPPPDGGEVPDSGLGPFVDPYQYRRLITPTNTVLAPAGATILIPVPHAVMLADGTSTENDGADLAVYQGPDRLEHQWSDQFVVGTDALVIVARLLRDLPIGGSVTDPLVLYSGDGNANLDVTDGVFEFAERFENPVDNNDWFQATSWIHCNVDRPDTVVYDPNNGPFGAYCAVDVSNANPARSTLATPALNTVISTPGANLTYEMSVWQAGRTVDDTADIIYFSYGPMNDVFDNTVEPTTYAGFIPNGTLTFQDTDNQPRTVSGWRYPTDVIQWWQRTTLRFLPTIDNPTLHWRYVSTDTDTSNNSASIIDDWWLRLAVDPDFTPILGSPEGR